MVSFDSYFLLGLGVRDVTFCYFFTGCNFREITFYCGDGAKGASGERVHRGKGCTLIFFLFLFTVEGEGGGGVCFSFSP